MGTVLRVFFTMVAIGTGLAVGEIVSSELKHQYKDFSKKREEDLEPIKVPKITILKEEPAAISLTKDNN